MAAACAQSVLEGKLVVEAGTRRGGCMRVSRVPRGGNLWPLSRGGCQLRLFLSLLG
jgi:hypothetical protein